MGSSTSKSNSSSTVAVAKEHRDSVNCIAICDDGSFIVTGSEDCTARVWSTRLDQVESLYVLEGHEAYITCVTISGDNIFTGSADKTIRKWDLATGACKYIYKGHLSRLTKLIATDKFLFSASTDGYPKVWIVNPQVMDYGDESAACIRTLVGHQKGISDLLFIEAESLPGDYENNVLIKPGDKVITASFDRTAMSWSLDSGKPLKKYRGHKGPVTCLCCDAERRNLYTASQDTTIRIWDIKTGKCNQVLEGHNNTILHLAIRKNMLYSGAADGTARSWSLEFGDSAREFRGHGHTITAILLNKGMLYTACGDSVIRVFDAKYGGLKKVLKGHVGAVTSIVCDDERLFSGGVDSTIHVWDISEYRGLSDSRRASTASISRSRQNSAVADEKRGTIGLTQASLASSEQVGKSRLEKTGSQILKEEEQARRLTELERRLSLFQQEGKLGSARKASSPSELSRDTIAEE